jgi:uncharacterized protein
MSSYLNFPFQIDTSGQTATADLATYVQNLIVLMLETDPGERVNRPDFGGGLKSLVFTGMDNSLASAAQTLVRSALLQFLGDAIAIHTLSVSLDSETVNINLTYLVTHTQQLAATAVTMPLPGGGQTLPGASGRATARISFS